MTTYDLISLIIDNLSRRKGRVALTAVGVVIGTAAIIILVSLGAGLQRDARERLGGLGDLTMIQVWPGFGMPGPGGGEPTQTILTDESVVQISALSGVAAVVPQDGLRSWSFLSAGQLQGGGQLLGVAPDGLVALGLEAEQGTLELRSGAVVIGAKVPENFYNPRSRPGQEPPPPPELMDKQLTLTLIKSAEDGTEIRKKVRVHVTGVIREVHGEPDWSVYVPMADLDGYNQWVTGKRVDHNKEGYFSIQVKAADISYVVNLAEQITDLGYNAWTQQTTVEGVNSFFTVLQVVFGGVGAIALLVAAIGIANTMAMAILERTREIGLMKAVGATNRHVLSVFLGEAAGIGFLGGLGGVAIGWGLGQVLNVVALAYLAGQSVQSGAPPPTVAVYTPLWLPIFALVFATIIGFLSGLYPALSAATLPPVTALKYE
ncbi:MAG TPA: ABC transporter permease [Candidatus Sulfomarinibacteraceae bacterium]|nr:ABC transporter permease [Candidatus Sulfomarinibacteraceae bacterium]